MSTTESQGLPSDSVTATVTPRTYVAEWGEEVEEVACPLCGGVQTETVTVGTDLLYGKPGKYPVVRCAGCGLSYVNPRPTFSSLGAHYPDDYFCYVPPEESPKLLRPIITSMARDTSLRRIQLIEKTVGPIQKDMKLLDVGCGLNDLLFRVKEERGAEGIGLDMKDTMVARSRDVLGMPIVEGTLVAAGFEAGRFDIVTMIEYLEHELDPMGALAEARRVTRPGGYLAIEIPEPEGWPARTFGKYWSNLDVPRHVVYFGRKTLEQAFRKSGFELVSYENFGIPFYTGVSVLFALGRHNAMRNTVTTPLLSGVLGAPFLPFLPWMKEFAFAIGRAV